ncbi:transposase family protein [Streptomyces sp. NPDC086835]|uniref:transposase family protein n=1 Tax=Streptomyces sp. NPDC086835 TaxID=3365761 RepID=UPI00382E044F
MPSWLIVRVVGLWVRGRSTSWSSSTGSWPPGHLVHLRHGVTHDVLACWFGVDRSTITRAVGEIRPVLADRGCRIEGGLRLRTLADVIAHLGATGQTALMDATEIRIRRPSAHRGGHSCFISGKSRINAIKALILTDERGRLLFCGEVRAGSVADITQARDAGLVDLLDDTIDMQILADAGYQGLAAQTYGQVVTPPRKRRGKHLEHLQWLMAHHEAARFAHSSARIPVEHGIAHLKNWRALNTRTARRTDLITTPAATPARPHATEDFGLSSGGDGSCEVDPREWTPGFTRRVTAYVT